MDDSKDNYFDDDSYDNTIKNNNNNNNIHKEPSPFAPSDLSISGIDTSLSSHYNSVILREKVVIVGDESVGKTSLVRSFMSNQGMGMDGTSGSIRNQDYQMTAGVEWNVKQVPIMKNNDANMVEKTKRNMNMNANTNITVDLFLFDIGGQSIFNQRGLSTRFYKNCSYIICVFDVSSRKTLQSCDTWIQAVQSASSQGQQEMAGIILIANKVDLREDNDSIVEVDDEEGMQFAKERNLPYFECCADRPSSVNAPFTYIATQAASRYQEEEEVDMEDETY